MNPDIDYITRVWGTGVLCMIILLYRTDLAAQERTTTVILDHADSLVGMELQGERVRRLIGNVKFHQGSVVVRCEEATQFLTSDRIDMNGEVEVIDDSLRMVGERGTYHGDRKMVEALERILLEDGTTTLKASYGRYFVEEKKAYFMGNVVVEDTASVLTSNVLTYYRGSKILNASGNVTIISRRDSIVVRGNRFEDDRNRKFSRMTENPELMKIERDAEGRAETLFVRSMILDSYRDTLQRLVAIDSVTIVRGGLSAEADLCIYHTDLDSIILRGTPIIWYTAATYEDTQVSGDSLFLRLRDRQLETLYVRGHAIALSRADSVYAGRFNQLSGQEISMHYTARRIDHITVERTATSLYYLFEDGLPNGLNTASGDCVTIALTNGKIDRITIAGGCEGRYVPERLVRDREAEYNLEGFNWRKDRPRHEGRQ